MIEKSSEEKAKGMLSSTIYNAGIVAYYHGDKISTYKYWMNSAKLGHVQSQKNLSVLCKKDSWACK